MKLYLIFFILILMNSCIYPEMEETLLAEHSLVNGKKVRIYFISPGATAQDVIQIREKGNDKIIANFEKYNYLKSSMLENDSTLKLVVSDTGYQKNPKFDTLLLKLK